MIQSSLLTEPTSIYIIPTSTQVPHPKPQLLPHQNFSLELLLANNMCLKTIDVYAVCGHNGRDDPNVASICEVEKCPEWDGTSYPRLRTRDQQYEGKCWACSGNHGVEKFWYKVLLHPNSSFQLDLTNGDSTATNLMHVTTSSTTCLPTFDDIPRRKILSSSPPRMASVPNVAA